MAANGRPKPGQLVGLVDIAARLGVDRETPIRWKGRGLLPEPLDIISGNVPVYWWADIEAWARATKRMRA